jgi:large repetitive protein
MSPRISALLRILAVACLVALTPLAAYAQACPQPIIVTTDPDVCPGSTGHASVEPPAGTTYTAISWSVVNGELPYGNSISSTTFLATGEGDVELSVTVTDGTGCQATNSVTIPLAVLAPPVITLYTPSVCPGSSPEVMGGYASTSAPQGVTYSTYEWSIVNGSITYGANSSGASFSIDGSAPAELTLTVTDIRGCQSTSEVTVEVRSIPPPVIQLYTPSVCPGDAPGVMGGYANTSAPEGTTYQFYEWSITNGSITYGQNSSGVSFKIDGTAPAELTLTVHDGYGCESSNSTTVDIRTIPPPVIQLYTPSVCPGDAPGVMGGYASTSAPEGTTYQTYDWSITNGSLTYGQNSSGISFKIDGTAPAVLSLTVRDGYGCLSTSSTTVAIRTIPPPVIQLYTPSVCPGDAPGVMGGYASTSAPEGTTYQTYEWSITNGSLTYGQNSSGISFKIDGTAPAVLTLTVRDGYGCLATSSTTVAIRTLPPPEINLSQPGLCPGSPGSASAGSPPAGTTYHTFDWSIVNGTITYGQDGPSISFMPDGTEPVGLTLTVRDGYGCTSTKSVTVPIGTVPEIMISAPNNCSTQVNYATLNLDYHSITWAITGGTILSGQGTHQLEFAGTGNGVVTVSATATKGTGCAGTSSVNIPGSTPNPPVELFAPETACPGALMKVGGATINGHHSFNWTVTNATVEGPTDQYEVSFRADGTGPVTVSATALEYWGCPTSNSVTIPLGPMPQPDIQVNYEPVCPGGGVNAYLYGPDDVFGAYEWTATNATILYNYGNQISLEHQPGTGDITLTVTVGEGACTATATRVIPVIPAVNPILELDGTTVCPNGVRTLYWDNFESYYSTASVTASNGTVLSTSPGRVPGGRTITVRADGTGDVTLYVYADSAACYQVRTLKLTLLPATATITPSGPTSFCEGGSVTLTANAGTTYLWSNGATTQSIVVAASGTYSVTVGQANGCSRTASRSVTVRPLPGDTITASGPLSFCQGGSVTLTAPAGSSYLWSNGATTPSITVSSGGLYVGYSVTVTSAFGCSRTTNPIPVSIHPYPPAGIEATINQEGAGSGTISRTGDSIQACGNPTIRLSVQEGDSYSWSTGATVNFIDVTSPGPYTVTATSNVGCATTSTVNVAYLPIPAKPAIASTGTELCPAGGSVTLTAPAADGWTWSTGATTQSIVVTEPGSYTVSVRNGTCDSPVSDPVDVTLGAPDATITAAAVCEGQPGTASVADAGAGATYAWTITNGTLTTANTATVTFTPTGLDPVELSVTVSNSCPVSSSKSVTINPLPIVTITPSGPTTFCDGGSVTLTATPGVSYSWSTGETTPSITVDGTGSYSVTVTNANGCSATSAPAIVTEHAVAVAGITASGPTTFCSGGSVTLTANEGASYLWSTGATTRSIDATTAGNYSVTVTNANGCSATSAVTSVTVNALPTSTISASGPTTFCAGGSVTLTASAGAGYVWSNGASTQSITVSEAGSYSVTVTNANGCSATSAATAVTVNALPTPSVTAGGPTTFCQGGNVTLTASAGASYAWSNGATTQSITVSDAGSYSVTVTNANGCSAASAATAVSVLALPEASITASGSTTFCEGASVTLTASAGASYVWSNGATTQSIDVTAAGAYSVTVTNAAGCSSTSSATAVSVNPLPVIAITPSGPTTFCEGGSVTLTATAGTSYSWSTGATTQSITVSDAGSYSVTVTNANGCSGTSAPIAVTENAIPAATVTASGPTTFCAGGSVTLTASAGASYLWSNGATTQSIDATAAGNYSVTVTNAAGCSATSAATSVTVNALPTATIAASGATTFCAGGSVTLTASAGASYAWSNGASTQSIIVSDAGSYSVTVTNANGCSATSAATAVTVNPLPTPTITAGGPTTFCQGGSVTLTASAGASYTWSNGATTQSITVFDAGSYSVAVTNAAGCSAASAATAVTVLALPEASITASGSTTFCAGGSVTLTASAGASYLWSNGASTQSIDVTSAGAYSVTVTNAAGCSSTSSTTAVTVNPLPVIAITPSGPTTFCEGGSVTLTATAGTSYSWSTGANTQSITVSDAGSYTVSVTNADGCSGTSAPMVVTENAIPAATITASGPTTFCTGSSVTLTASAGASYLWSNGATTQSISATAAGNYSVTVTSAAGCSATSAATSITVNALPAATITADGPTTFCVGGSVTLTASAGTSYAWSNGATTPSISVTESGSYTVTVTNANGCSATSAATAVTAKPLPVVTTSANGPTTFCQGGSVTLTGHGGVGMGTWYRNGVAYSTSYTLTVSSPGTMSYFYRALENGCWGDSAPVTVTVHPNPALGWSGNSTVCWTGSGWREILGAVAGSTYAWTVTNGTVVSGATDARVYYSPAAGATTVGLDVIITTPAGCTKSQHFDVPVDRETPAAISAFGPTTFCPGGSVTLTMPTAPSGWSYLWSNFATTQSITVSSSGTYTARYVKIAGSCVGPHSEPVMVTVSPLPAATITPSGPTTFCTGGSVTLTASAGASYLWSNGETTPSITVSDAGNYSVTVTSAAGCSATSSATTVTLTAPPAVNITPSGPTTFCQGGSVTLTATAGASYLWSNGATTQSITVSDAGSYSTTVSFSAGCSRTSAATVVTVNPFPTPTIDVSGPTTFCEGGSVTLTGQGGSGSWYRDGSFYASGASINVTTVGAWSFVYRVTTAGCTANSAPVAVTVNPKPYISSSGGYSIICWNSPSWHEINDVPAGSTISWTVTNGTIVSGANDTRVYYQPTAEATSVGLDATMTNSAGCSTTRHFDVPVDRTTPTITPSGPTTFCTGGSVTLTMPTAPSGYYYQWSNGANTQSITVSSSGTYTAHYYKLSSGCHGPESEPVTVVVEPLPTAAITPSGATTFCAGGSVTLTASAGSSYLWSTGATTQSIDTTTAGNYSVTVTNAGGCSATSPATAVTVNPLPAATISGPDTFCEGGSITLTASAGSSYLWSTGAITQSINVATVDSYSVTVTNANGCSATSAAKSVAMSSAAIPTISGATAFCAGGSTTLTASAGSSYLWSTGATSPSINVTAAGNYSVTVTYANGCSRTSPDTVVTVNPLPTATITASGSTSFCPGGSVTLTASAGASYLWSTGATTPSINVSTGGNYSVTVTNANGCSATSPDTVVTINPVPTATITASGSTSFCTGGSVTLTASAGASYLWSNGQTSPSINVSTGGNYSVIVTNANGCSATSAQTTVTVSTYPATPTVTASGPTTFCAGGSVTLTAPAGYSYLWSNGATSQSINVNATANYSVIVTNAGGCSTSSTATSVTVNPVTVITQQPVGGTIPKNTSRLLTVTATGTALSYQWYRGASGVTTTPVGTNSSQYQTPVLTKGTYQYWVRVTGTCGVVNSVTATIVAN